MSFHRAFFFLICLFLSSPGFSQLEFGLKAGLSPGYEPNTHYIFINRDQSAREFTFDALQQRSAVYAGAFVDYPIDQFFLRGEILYNRHEMHYSIGRIGADVPITSGTSEVSEVVHQLDIPLSFGVHLSPAFVFSGITGHLVLSKNSELTALPGFESDHGIRLSWQTGVGVQLGPSFVEVRYQMEFSNYGSHLTFENQSMELFNAPGRLIATVGFSF